MAFGFETEKWKHKQTGTISIVIQADILNEQGNRVYMHRPYNSIIDAWNVSDSNEFEKYFEPLIEE